MKRNENILTALLRALGIPHTRTYADRLLKDRPKRGTLYDLSLLLRRYGIGSKGVKWHDKDNLDGLPSVFVAQVGSDFVVVRSHDDRQVTYEQQGRTLSAATTVFADKWTGIALLPVPNEQSGEPGYTGHRREECALKIRKGLTVICTVVLTCAGMVDRWTNGQTAHMLLALSNFVGIYLCYLLLSEQLRRPQPMGERLCHLIRPKGCHEVLHADEARLLGLFSWSEVGMAYFSLNVLLLLYAPSAAGYLGWLSVGAALFSFWSVWYQWRRAKTWCTLCLLVQVLFWIQLAGFALSELLSGFTLHFGKAISLGAGYAAALLFVHWVTDLLERTANPLMWRRAYRTLLLKPQVFAALTDTSVRYPNGHEASTLIFGAPDAPIQLTVYTNPYCGPCALMHRRLERVVGPEVCVQYVFTAFRPEWEVINRYFIAAYQTLGAETCKDLLGRWFKGGREQGEAFFADYRLDPESSAVQEEFARQQAWGQTAALKATPRLLVNGYVVPTIYRVEDLPYVWDTLTDKEETPKNETP